MTTTDRIEGIELSELCLADVLKTTGGAAYVIRKMHWEPVRIGKGSQRRMTYPLVGFTLLETTTLTDREVSARELQQQFDDRTMYLYLPPVARRLTKMLAATRSTTKKPTNQHGATTDPDNGGTDRVGDAAADRLPGAAGPDRPDDEDEF